MNNRKIREIFFLANNLIILPPRFDIKIFEITSNNITDRFRITTYREFRGLAIFLGYNLMIFYLD